MGSTSPASGAVFSRLGTRGQSRPLGRVQVPDRSLPADQRRQDGEVIQDRFHGLCGRHRTRRVTWSCRRTRSASLLFGAGRFRDWHTLPLGFHATHQRSLHRSTDTWCLQRSHPQQRARLAQWLRAIHGKYHLFLECRARQWRRLRHHQLRPYQMDDDAESLRVRQYQLTNQYRLWHLRIYGKIHLGHREDTADWRDRITRRLLRRDRHRGRQRRRGRCRLLTRLPIRH